MPAPTIPRDAWTLRMAGINEVQPDVLRRYFANIPDIGIDGSKASNGTNGASNVNSTDEGASNSIPLLHLHHSLYASETIAVFPSEEDAVTAWQHLKKNMRPKVQVSQNYENPLTAIPEVVKVLEERRNGGNGSKSDSKSRLSAGNGNGNASGNSDSKTTAPKAKPKVKPGFGSSVSRSQSIPYTGIRANSGSKSSNGSNGGGSGAKAGILLPKLSANKYPIMHVDVAPAVFVERCDDGEEGQGLGQEGGLLEEEEGTAPSTVPSIVDDVSTSASLHQEGGENVENQNASGIGNSNDVSFLQTNVNISNVTTTTENNNPMRRTFTRMRSEPSLNRQFSQTMARGWRPQNTQEGQTSQNTMGNSMGNATTGGPGGMLRSNTGGAAGGNSNLARTGQQILGNTISTNSTNMTTTPILDVTEDEYLGVAMTRFGGYSGDYWTDLADMCAIIEETIDLKAKSKHNFDILEEFLAVHRKFQHEWGGNNITNFNHNPDDTTSIQAVAGLVLKLVEALEGIGEIKCLKVDGFSSDFMTWKQTMDAIEQGCLQQHCDRFADTCINELIGCLDLVKYPALKTAFIEMGF